VKSKPKRITFWRDRCKIILLNSVKVTSAELEAYLDKQRASIKILHAEVEYLEGEWDTCDTTGINDSRFGSYVIIKRLID